MNRTFLCLAWTVLAVDIIGLSFCENIYAHNFANLHNIADC